VVVADTHYGAHDAANAVQVDYEPLPAVVDLVQAMDPGSPMVHASAASNIAWDVNLDDAKEGDIDPFDDRRYANAKAFVNFYAILLTTCRSAFRPYVSVCR
jgi:CO/xanthine dehydrogenase Mo-binding subunit